MEEQLQAILAETEGSLNSVEARPELDQLKASVLGSNGKLTALMKGIGSLPQEERPAFGQAVNKVKKSLEELFQQAVSRVESTEDATSLGEPIDVTLPPPGDYVGGLHPLTQTKRRIVSIFRKIGFTVAEATEVETEWYCFDALNTPEDHPARDEQDSLYFPPNARFGNVSRKGEEAHVLRTHTSSVQIRTMLAEKPPIRVIAPGRCFRRDTVDATHSANFHQTEGLYVDRMVTIKDLKTVLDHLLRELFGKEVKTRLRPSFFPFTEPSFEVDLFTPNLGRLSNKWIEIMGCGMIDPNVFVNVDVDPEEWTGYAFGLGIERVAMMLHGIDDIRHFYQNDLR
ncbi:MAG: phenylalanine--tRNA ligase subunit alpha, partial [Opitutales bacterium]